MEVPLEGPPLLPNPEEPEDELDHLQEEAAEEQAPEEPSLETPPEQLPVQEKPKPVPMLEAQFDAGILKEFLKEIAAIDDEAKMVVDRDGWHVRAVDPAHIAFVALDLPLAVFRWNYIQWKRPPEEGGDPPASLEFGIDVEKLLEILKKPKGPVSFRYVGDSDPGTIQIEMGPETRTTSAVDASGMGDLKDVKLNLPVEFTIGGKALLEALKACEAVSDHCILTVDNGGEGGTFRLVVSAEGDVDRYQRVFSDEVKRVRHDGSGYRSMFPLDYMERLVKSVKDCNLSVQMSTDYPIDIRWTDRTVGRYALAPRIETD